MDFHLRQAACVDVRGKITTKVCRNRERYPLISCHLSSAFKSESMGAPGRCATCHLSDFADTWPVHPTGLIRFFTNKRALITGKSRRLSGQLFLTFDYQGLCICWYIFNKCKNISFSQFDWQLVNHRPWIWNYLFSHSIICWFWDRISLLARKLWQ